MASGMWMIHQSPKIFLLEWKPLRDQEKIRQLNKTQARARVKQCKKDKLLLTLSWLSHSLCALMYICRISEFYNDQCTTTEYRIMYWTVQWRFLVNHFTTIQQSCWNRTIWGFCNADTWLLSKGGTILLVMVIAGQ